MIKLEDIIIKEDDRPDWIRKKNILSQDLIMIGVKFVVLIILFLHIIFYIFLCVFHDKNEINIAIKDMFNFIFFEKW